MSLTLVVLPEHNFLLETMGVSLFGVVMAAFLYGITGAQVIYYFVWTVPDAPQDRRDGWVLKTLVLFVFAFDTIHMMLITHTMYYYLVSHHNDPAALNECVWSLLLEVLFNGLVALLVQGFLTNRVWRLSKRVPLTGVACLLVLAEFVCIFTFAVDGLIRVKTFEDLAKMKGLSITVNALAAISDLYIALALCWLLHSSQTGYRKSDTLVRKLSIYALNTGAVTSACALASLVSIIAAPNTFIYIMFFFCIGRLYANSLLASLNMRPHVRTLAENNNFGSSLFDDVKFATMTSTRTKSRNSNREKCGCHCHSSSVDEKVKNDNDGEKRRSQSFSIHLSDIIEEGSDTCGIVSVNVVADAGAGAGADASPASPMGLSSTCPPPRTVLVGELAV
ncbi:hypothetical protein E1B28_003701 [Marasmius oreades]|uniref:DUF6534 domain-containing protein n=1 Tax=Marasmius oreades TaxID=181124 RepID=A0A9P8ABL4_9AGAR|nr:uncharacterized protein E1B28_003701 [Marasmius oreades]KAG7096253.1 hypothetical protein E1B28_003701 [Marasmius oreades]